MFSKTIVTLAVFGLLTSATAAFAQVGGGNELPRSAKMKGGMMGKHHMKKMHHHSMKMKKMNKAM